MYDAVADPGSSTEYSCIYVCTQLGYTCLHQAAQQGQLAVINLLLKYEASPNAVTHVSLKQPLHYYS